MATYALKGIVRGQHITTEVAFDAESDDQAWENADLLSLPDGFITCQDKAIGVPGWADNDCDLCGSNEERLLRIGEEPDYEARWVDLCAACLAKAAASLAPSLEQDGAK